MDGGPNPVLRPSRKVTQEHSSGLDILQDPLEAPLVLEPREPELFWLHHFCSGEEAEMGWTRQTQVLLRVRYHDDAQEPESVTGPFLMEKQMRLRDMMPWKESPASPLCSNADRCLWGTEPLRLLGKYFS